MRSGKGRLRRYPAEAQAWAVTHAETELAQGQSVGAIAAKLGMSDMTLRGWLYSASRQQPGELCQVVVTPSPPPPKSACRVLTLRCGVKNLRRTVRT